MIVERPLPKGLTIGQGYDLDFGDAYGIAVHTRGFHREEYDEAIAKKLYIPQSKLKPRGWPGVAQKEGQEIEYNLLQIDSSESLSQALDLSVSASFGYPGILTAVDVSTATRFSASQKINQFSTYVLVSVVVKNPPLLIENPALTPEAAEIWDDGKGRSQFYQNFGSSYLLGYVPGGILYGLIEISTENIAQKRYLKTLLNGSISTFKGRGELSNQFRQELEVAGQDKKLKVSILQLGGSGDTVDDDVESLLEQARTFPALVRDYPVYSFGIFADYKTLLTEAGPPESLVAEQSATIAALGQKYLRYRDYLGNLEYVMDDSHFYRFPEHLGSDAKDLRNLRERYERERQRVAGEMDVLELRAKRCRDVQNMEELLQLLPVKTGGLVPKDLWLYLEDRSQFEIEKNLDLPREDMVELNGMTRMVAGSIGADGRAIAGRGFRSSKEGKGRYHIEFDRPFRHPPTVIVSVDGDPESRVKTEAQADNLVATYQKNEREFYVKTISAHRVEEEEETGFSFIAIEFII